jgi:hypothetical protein
MKLPEVVQAINVYVLENRGKFFQDVAVVPGKYHLLIGYSMYGDGTHLVAFWYSQCTSGLVIVTKGMVSDAVRRLCEKEVFGPAMHSLAQKRMQLARTDNLADVLLEK